MSPPDGGKFARCMGQFIMNCGNLEFHTYSWMRELSPNFELPIGASHMSGASRVSWIRKRLKASALNKNIRDEVFNAMDSVRDVYELRNIVAHGPLFWATCEDGSLIGHIPNVRKMMKGKLSNVVRFSDISKAASISGSLYYRLCDLRQRSLEDLGIQGFPPPFDIGGQGGPRGQAPPEADQ